MPDEVQDPRPPREYRPHLDQNHEFDDATVDSARPAQKRAPPLSAKASTSCPSRLCDRSSARARSGDQLDLK